MSDEKEVVQKVEIIEDTVPQPPPKKKRKKPTHARLIASDGEAVLVEWNDGKWQRSYIPASAYDFERASADLEILQAGIPYGVDWSKVELNLDSVALDQELKRRGIWTLNDMRTYPEQANAAINLVSGIMRKELEKLARKEV